MDSDYLFGNCLRPLNTLKNGKSIRLRWRSDREGWSVTAAGNHVTEADPGGTVEFCELDLSDRATVRRAGVHFDAGQQGGKLEVMQTECLLHNVLTREVAFALLQHLQHCLAESVSEDIEAVAGVSTGHMFGHEVAPFVHSGIIFPGGIGRILQVPVGDYADGVLRPRRF